MAETTAEPARLDRMPPCTSAKVPSPVHTAIVTTVIQYTSLSAVDDRTPEESGL